MGRQVFSIVTSIGIKFTKQSHYDMKNGVMFEIKSTHKFLIKLLLQIFKLVTFSICQIPHVSFSCYCIIL